MRTAPLVAAVAVLAATAPGLVAQTVPQEFQGVYSELSAALSRSTLTRGWDGGRTPVLFGTEVTPASAYTAVLQPGYYERSVTPFLDALQTLGNVRVAKVLLHYPLLYLPFYTDWPQSGGRAAYDARLAFYKRLAADLHARGIKLMVQSMAQGFGDFASIESDTLNLGGYYRTVSFDQYIAARSAQALTICREIRPDYLNFDSEPDMESSKALQPALDAANPDTFITNNLRLVTTIRDTLEKADPPIPGLHSSLRLIIGMGSWQRYFATLARAYARMPGIDIIDIHVHPINASSQGDYLANIGTIADIAIAEGKAVGMNETWLYHESAAELGQIGAPQVEVRQNWSFFAPVDIAFLTLMMNVANYKRMEYVSFATPSVFFSYLDYEKTPGCPTPPSTSCTVAQWNTAANRAFAAAILSKPVPLTATGQAFKTLLAAQPSLAAQAAVVSAAGYGPGIAPDSLVSIFGEKLAPSTVTVRGSDTVMRPVTVLLATPQQINALLPAGLPTGPGEVTVTPSDGAVTRIPVTIAPVAPGLFTAGTTNIAAAIAVTAKADGTQSIQYTAQCSATACTANPIDLGAPEETTALVLYGTGFRAAALGEVAVTIGGVAATVFSAGAQSQFPGLDQVNVILPRALAGRGTLEVKLSARGIPANTVQINLR
jgi:uncharacterized protein (TIGR03437 family)